MNIFSKFGFTDSPISRSEYFWLDSNTDPATAQLFKASTRLRIKRKGKNYWLQYKTPLLPPPCNDFLYKTHEEQKWKLQRSIARKIVTQGHALSTELPCGWFLDFVQFEVFAISMSEKRRIRNGDLEIIFEQFQKAGDNYFHCQVEIRSLNPVSVRRFRSLLEQELEIRRPVSKLNYVWGR